MDLFKLIIPEDRQHPIFYELRQKDNKAEREVLQNWAAGFIDRDNKFIKQFQTTFESSMWELYIHAVLKEIGSNIDFSFPCPDFIVNKDKVDFCIEATIASTPKGGLPPYSLGIPNIMPDGQYQFNVESAIRICNSISSKFSKYKDSYEKLAHVKNKPFVIALAPFDRPGSHLSTNIPIIMALYGIYNDEELTIETSSKQIICTPMDFLKKRKDTLIQCGYFTNSEMSDISAIIYSPVATWGKIRALAKRDNPNMIFTTTHPGRNADLNPETRKSYKSDYREHLLDGIYLFHNPFAKTPFPIKLFNRPEITQYYWDAEGKSKVNISPDFLISRIVFNTIIKRNK